MPKPKRIAEVGVRHRRDNGPAILEVKEVQPPSADELGQATKWTRDIITGGPRGIVASEHVARKLAAKFGEVFEAQWCLRTKWLEQLCVGHRGRKQVKYALTWRPTFLAVMALTRSMILGARGAKISVMTAYNHRKLDADFDAQCCAAEEYAVQLLHDVTFKSAIEGDLEPIYWQGICVGHVKKYDNRLRIEMLRAHMPKKFKTPGDRGIAVSGDNNQILVCDKETIQMIQESRQRALKAMEAADLALADAPR